MVDKAISITLPTFRTVFGGSRSTTESTAGLRRAKTDSGPRIRSQHRFKGDEILTRQDNKGAQVLGRIAKSRPGPPKVMLEKQAPKRRETPKTGTPLSGTGQVIDTPPQFPQTPEKSPFEKLQDSVGECLTKFSRLGQKPELDKLLSPRERLKAASEHTSLRVEIKVNADKLLTEVSTSLKSKSEELAGKLKEGALPHDPEIVQLRSEITQLKASRTQLVSVQICTELGGLRTLRQEPIHKGSAMAALWALHGPGDISQHRLISEDLIKDISAGVDAFNDGAETITLQGGTTVDLAGFGKLISNLVEGGSALGKTEIGQRSLNELRDLARCMTARSDLQEAMKTLEGILDKTPDFPVGGAIVAFSSALPSLGKLAQRSDAHSLELTAGGLRTLSEMVGKGDIFPSLTGIDNTFDAACTKIQVKRGGDLAVELLNKEFSAQHGGMTTKTFEQLVSTPFEQLTVKERSAVLDFTGETRQGTQEKALKTLTDRRAAGENAVKLRTKLTEANQTLARMLTADRRRFLQPSTWGDKREKVFESSPNSIAKDAVLMKALAKFSNSATGRDVAILLAHISELERKTLGLEQTAQGLHPGLDTSVLKPDPRNPLLHIGITNKELEAIHVKPEEFDGIAKVVEKLHGQGVGNVDDIQAFNKTINDVSRLVLKSELTHDMIRSYEGESARALGEHLANELMRDADLSYRRKYNVPEPPHTSGFRPTTSEDTVVSFFNERVAGLKVQFDKSHASAWDNLKTSAQAYSDLEVGISTDYRDRLDVQKSIDEHETFLANVNEAGVHETLDDLTFNVDPRAPRGLRSAKLIGEALRHLDDFKAGDKDALKRMNDALEKLRGFDLETMRRPWYGKVKAFFGGGTKPDIRQLRKLQEVAEAIVYVRQDAPKRLEQIEDSIETRGADLDRLLQTRRQQSPEAMRQVTDMVRIAVLAEWKRAKADFGVKDGTVSEGYNPAIDPAHKAILETLARWGLKDEDLDRFAPEIDSVLFSRMTGDDVVRWAGEANWSDATIETYRLNNPELFSTAGILETWQGIKQSFSIDGLLNRKVMDEATKDSLLNMLSSFQEGDKLDLKSGQRITLDSGKIPVEPTGLAGIRARLAVSHLGQFEIERGSDGFKLHLRSGFAGKGNLDAIVGHNFTVSDNLQLSAQGSLGLEAGGSDLTGVSLSFKNDEGGLKSLIDLVAKMVDNEEIDLWDWQDATDVGSSLEHRVKLGVNTGATGTMLVGGKGPELDDKQDTLGVGLKGQISAGLFRGTKSNTTESLNETTRKGEVEWSVVLGAGVSVYANLYNPMNIGTGFAATESGGQKSSEESFGKESTTGKDNYVMNSNTQSTDLIGISGTMTAAYTDKWKHVSDGNGLFKKCEIVRQSNVRQGVVQAFAVCDTPELRMILQGKKPEHIEFAKSFKSFMDLAKSDDFIAVTYGLKEDALKQANEFMHRANTAEREGNTDLANNLRKKARKIATAKDNYIPQKIGLVTTSVKSGQIMNLNARYISWSTFSDGKSEHTGATLAIPKPQ